MSDVQFDESATEYTPTESAAARKSPKSLLVGVLVRLHLAKDWNGAQKLLLGVAIAFLVVAALVFVISYTHPRIVQEPTNVGQFKNFDH